jgi:hypothetical protein
MSAKIEITLPFTSRFKRTELYTKAGKAFFGVWNPSVIKLDGDEKIYKVPMKYEGNLDLIAYQEYKDSSLWWVIALVNNIIHPPDEVKAGMLLTIPKLNNIKFSLLSEE